MRKMITVMLFAMLMTGCASNKLSWDTLRENIDNPDYCKSSFAESGEIDNCRVEMAARKRAKELCAQEKQSERCEINARYAWEGHKFHLDDKVGMNAAEIYPVTCGYDEETRRPCQTTIQSK